MTEKEYRAQRHYQFTLPSFWTGVARLFDFGLTLTPYRIARTQEEADEIDARAIWGDFLAVGKDLLDARDIVHEHRRGTGPEPGSR